LWYWLWNYSRRWYYYRDHLCCLLLPHSTYFIRQFLVLVLFVGYCFGEIVCIWDSYVYQKVFFVSLFIKVMSGRLKVIVFSVIMLRFQYSLTLLLILLLSLLLLLLLLCYTSQHNGFYAVEEGRSAGSRIRQWSWLFKATWYRG